VRLHTRQSPALHRHHFSGRPRRYHKTFRLWIPPDSDIHPVYNKPYIYHRKMPDTPCKSSLLPCPYPHLPCRTNPLKNPLHSALLLPRCQCLHLLSLLYPAHKFHHLRLYGQILCDKKRLKEQHLPVWQLTNRLSHRISGLCQIRSFSPSADFLLTHSCAV